MSSKATLTVTVTGAAGQIGYSLVPLIANGKMFGPDQPVSINMLDIEPAMKSLGGVVMELQDGAYPLLRSIVATADIKTAFTDADVVILVGAMPRKPGMERADLLKVNCGIFKTQGEAINNYSKPNVKVLVVGNPANTNCGIAQACAPRVPARNFTCLTRLDHNRATSQLAIKAGTSAGAVKNVIIWGNHSSTQFPDAAHAQIDGRPAEAVAGEAFTRGDFISTVQKRGAAIMDARGLSSAMSAANAIADHMHDWFLGTRPGEHVSMGVLSNGEYGVPAGIIYSYPVTCKDGEWEIVKGLEISAFARNLMDLTAKELLEEKTTAHSFLD